MQRVALVEPNHSHEEVLYPLTELLRGHSEVYVVAPQTLLDVDLMRGLSSCHAVPYINALPATRRGRISGVFNKYLAIRNAVDQIDPGLIIFNSVPTLLEAALIGFYFRKWRKIQVIHNFQNYLLPGARSLYKLFDGNLVISEQVFNYIQKNHSDFHHLDYFLPIFFDGFRITSDATPKVMKGNPDCITLGVFGAIEERRRNYNGLLQAIKHIAATDHSPRFRIYLAGKAPLWVQQEVRKYHLENFVEFYPEFLPFKKMFELLVEIDLVMFLIDDSVPNAKHYNRYKITGTSTLVKAFNKLCVSSKDFLLDDSLASRCFHYDGVDIATLLKSINDGQLTRKTIEDKVAACKENSEFSFVRQQEKLLSMINKVLQKP